MKKRRKPFFLIFFSAFFFTSCGVHVSLRPTASGAKCTIVIDMGSAFLETVFGMSGIEDASLSDIFNTEELRGILLEEDFSDVTVMLEDEKRIKISGEFKWDSKNPLVLSKIASPSSSGGVQLIFSAENLQGLYGLLPQDFKNYLDMFMSPSFTGEQMSDDEYLDLLASVYGDVFVSELKNAVMRFSFVGNGSRTIENVLSLIKILNIVGELGM